MEFLCGEVLANDWYMAMAKTTSVQIIRPTFGETRKEPESDSEPPSAWARIGMVVRDASIGLEEERDEARDEAVEEARLGAARWTAGSAILDILGADIPLSGMISVGFPIIRKRCTFI